MPSEIPEVDADCLSDMVLRATDKLEPVIVRGVASDLPVVNASNAGDRALLDYLLTFARPAEVTIVHAGEEVQGKFGYTPDLSAFNFKRIKAAFPDFLHALQGSKFPPGAVAIQGVQTDVAAPGFSEANALPFLPDGGEYRMWLGTRAEVAIHCDPAPNVAFVAAGKRRFTLFAPEEIGNLYLGPFDPVPSGTQISLADPMAPDLARFPRFAGALERSRSAELRAGDAIFIPTGWYHHVQARAPLNLLINYWWRSRHEGPSPWDALMHGFMTLRGLPPAERRVWRAMFNHYIFEDDGYPGEHIPAGRRGILEHPTPQMLGAMREAVLRSLSESIP